MSALPACREPSQLRATVIAPAVAAGEMISASRDGECDLLHVGRHDPQHEARRQAKHDGKPQRTIARSFHCDAEQERRASLDDARWPHIQVGLTELLLVERTATIR